MSNQRKSRRRKPKISQIRPLRKGKKTTHQRLEKSQGHSIREQQAAAMDRDLETSREDSEPGPRGVNTVPHLGGHFAG